MKQPQEFWICDICINNLNDEMVTVHIREDKFRKHAKQEHASEEPKELCGRSRVDYEAKFDPICTYVLPLDQTECGHRFRGTWKDRYHHWIKHFDDENGGETKNDGLDDPKFDGDGDDDDGGDTGASGSAAFAFFQESSSSGSFNASGTKFGASETQYQGYSCSSYALSCEQSPMHFPLFDVRRRFLAVPPRGTRYFALSYVWGDKSAPLQVEFFESHRKGSHSPLSDSFRTNFDTAIYLAKDMCCDYLWIDALCSPSLEQTEKDVIIAESALVIVMADKYDQIWHMLCQPSELTGLWKKSK